MNSSVLFSLLLLFSPATDDYDAFGQSRADFTTIEIEIIIITSPSRRVESLGIILHTGLRGVRGMQSRCENYLFVSVTRLF